MVWSSQSGGSPRHVPGAMELIPDPRARHYWDGDLQVGDLFRSLPLDGETVDLSDAAWDAYLLFDGDARWPSGSPPPVPAWWEHQLWGLPEKRLLDAGRFADKAAELAARAAHPAAGAPADARGSGPPEGDSATEPRPPGR